MKSILILALLLTVAAAPTILVSAQTPNPLFRHIPPDADVVYHVHLPVLTSKLSLTAIFTTLNTGRLPFGPSLMAIRDLVGSGIDTTKDFVITRCNVYNKDSLRYTTIIAHLTDSGKFVAFLRTHEHGLDYFYFSTDPGLKYLHGSVRMAISHESAYAWNDRLVVMMVIHYPASATSNDMSTPAPGADRRCAATLNGFDHSFFTTDPAFLAAFSDDADAHFWNRSGTGNGALSMIMKSPGLQEKMGGLPPLFANSGQSHSSSFGTLRFETGKISFQNRSIRVPPDSTHASKFISTPLDASLLASIPPGKLLGMIALHHDINTIADLPNATLPSADIRQALTGDFLILAYDPPDPQLVPHRSATAPLLYVVARISDKPAFERVAKALKISGPTDAADSDSSGMHAHYAFENDAAVISFTPQAVDRYLHPDAAQTPAHPERRFVTEDLRANSSVMAGIDFGTLTSFLQASKPSTLDLLRHFDSFLLTATTVHGNESITQYELKLADTRRNSLPVLIETLGPLFRP